MSDLSADAQCWPGLVLAADQPPGRPSLWRGSARAVGAVFAMPAATADTHRIVCRSKEGSEPL